MNHYLAQHDLIRAVQHYPEKIAFIISDISYSYKDFYTDVLRLSNQFMHNGLLRGDRVVILDGNSYLAILGFYASLFCDAVPCMLDFEMDRNTLERVLISLKPKIGVSVHPNISELLGKRKIRTVINLSESMEVISALNTEADVAMIMHTSGSTGIPKGVVLSHRNVCSAIESIQSYLKLHYRDIILSVLPLHFDYGLYQVFLSVHNAATLILHKNALIPQKIITDIEKYKVTIFPAVPFLIQLIDIVNKQLLSDLSTIRLVTNTGEHLTPKHIAMVYEIFTNANLFSMYGLTECKRCSYVPPEKLSEKNGSIGIPMPNLEMILVNDRECRIETAEEEGDLWISGPTVMQYYWGDEKSTANKIRVLGNKRYLITGDRAYFDRDGYFYFKGRKDAQLKFKGEKFFSEVYLKKLRSLSFISRAHIFLNGTKLIVCLESSEKLTLDQRQTVFKVFPNTQKPNEIYSAHSFPALSNGKLAFKQLEAEAIDAIASSKEIIKTHEEIQ